MTPHDSQYLKICVDSIYSTLSGGFEIYIVDNGSNDQNHITILKVLENYPEVTIIRNKKNRWILGLNDILDVLKEKSTSKYFVLTDGDIKFLPFDRPISWLEYLIQQMDRRPYVGKIGMSLSWDILEKNKSLNNILAQEQSLYSDSKKIDELYISQVDTTAAIYRWDWSVEKSCSFYPDHMNYLRPELYSCRTPRNLLVEHLGWNSYLVDNTENNVDEKVVCFTLLAGSVKKEIKEKASYKVRAFHSLLSGIIAKFWIVRRWCIFTKYCLEKIIKGEFYGRGV